MRIETVAELPKFDSGQFEGAEFVMSRGNAELVTHVAGEDDVVVSFTRVRWHEFTAKYNCSSEQLKGAYLAVAEIVGSTRLSRFISEDKAISKAYKILCHFRVFLEEHGCHEVFAESVAVDRRSVQQGLPPNTSFERTREG